MRIITGIYKGRRLFSPKDNSIRPTSDMVKESIFNMIAPDINDSVVVDLFCGSGNLGIEAASRGARKVYFVDKSRESIELTRKNIEHCKASNNSVVVNSDFENALKNIKEKVDIILMDPPYEADLIIKAFDVIRKTKVLNDHGIILVEHGYKQDIPENIAGFVLIKKKRYGQIFVEMFMNPMEEE